MGWYTNSKGGNVYFRTCCDRSHDMIGGDKGGLEVLQCQRALLLGQPANPAFWAPNKIEIQICLRSLPSKVVDCLYYTEVDGGSD